MKTKKPRETKQLKFVESKPRKNTKAFIVEENLGYGGEINYRKVKRPFSNRGTTHAVLQSDLLVGNRSLLKNNHKNWIEKLIRDKVRKYYGSVYELSVNSNHIHLLTKFNTPQMQANFLRDISGTLAKKLRKIFKIVGGKFWSARPFTKLYNGSAFNAIRNYIRKNIFEAHGIWNYTPRPISVLTKLLQNFKSELQRQSLKSDFASPLIMIGIPSQKSSLQIN